MKIRERTDAAMPLTSVTTCYRTLPSYFAEQVTRHVRKRRDPRRSPSQQDDPEVKEATQVTSRGPTNAWADTDQVTMTKRSCTPLATVSDNDSEDESQGVASVTNSQPSVSSRHASPTLPLASGGLGATLSYFIRPNRAQISPRTAISLDNVDLWEDSDSEDRGPSPFDRIDGVSINPRVTIDFSELRRSRSPVDAKRNKLDESGKREQTTGHDVVQTVGFSRPRALSDLQAELTAAKSRLLENRAAKPRARIYNRKLIPTQQVLPDKPKPQTEAKDGKKLGSPMDTNRNVSMFQYPRLTNMDGSTTASPNSRTVLPKPPRASSYHVTPDTQVISATPAMPHVTTNVTVNHVISTAPNQTSVCMPYVNSTPTKVVYPSSSPCGTITTPTMPPVTTINPSTTGSTKHAELHRINRKIRSARAQMEDAKTHVTSGPQQQPIRGDLRRVQELEVRGSGDSTGSTCSSPDRKVKFNNYVTVRQGDSNTVDTLRESNNSAQAFKQKYLGNNVHNSNSSSVSAQPNFKSKMPARIKLVF